MGWPNPFYSTVYCTSFFFYKLIDFLVKTYRTYRTYKLLLVPVLRIRDFYPGSRIECFPSRILGQKDSRIRIRTAPKNLSILTRKLFLSARKYNPGCWSRIRIFIFYPSRISDLGLRDQKSTGSGSATLAGTVSLRSWVFVCVTLDFLFWRWVSHCAPSPFCPLTSVRFPQQMARSGVLPYFIFIYLFIYFIYLFIYLFIYYLDLRMFKLSDLENSGFFYTSDRRSSLL